MIIKKPYAFLIKNFRIIHGALFAILFYLSLKTLSIFSFFNGYVSDMYYTNTGTLESDFINYFMFFAGLVAILISFVVYYLLMVKRKKDNLYLYTSIYQIAIIIYFLVMFSIFQDLNTKSIAMESVRFYRDVSAIVLVPQVILTLLIFGRALGFNVRQFEFNKDLEELEIDATDNEEVEVTFGSNSYKLMRFIRKFIRLTRYFIIENKIFIICLASILVFSLSLTVFMKIRVYDIQYRENEKIVANSLQYNIKNSYITTTDVNNKIINKDKSYLLIETTITNNLYDGYLLSRDTFRLELGEELIFPSFTFKNEFIDLGKTFAPFEVKSGAEETVLLVFEIENKKLEKNYSLKIKNYDNLSIGSIKSLYKTIIIKPKDLNKIDETFNYKLVANIDFDNSVLGKSNLTIKSISIEDKFKDKYSKCNNKNECKDINYSIIPDNIGKGELSVLKISGTSIIDNEIPLIHEIDNIGNIIEYYGALEYDYVDEIKQSSISMIKIKKEDNTNWYFNVPEEVKYSKKIDLILTIRGIKYIINLK